MPPIHGSKILIIGGSTGIGYGVAEKCLTEGAIVHIASSNESKVSASVQALKEKLNGAPISGHVCDLSSGELEKDLERLLRALAPIDHIVFTAGDSLAIKPLDSINLCLIQSAGHVRFAVPLLIAKLAPRFMKPGYTSSITLTTGAGYQKPFPAGHWSPVNLVSPGAVATPLWGNDGPPEETKDRTTLGKFGTLDEVAEAYIYLMKDTNATGSCVSTNGGSFLL
ncbi:putative short-chain dehydrogenase [Aspergillus udagawae]|uniref:Short-chain dehydrogenase n=1 Tax=Aspergillus udagawae TaxID=91492 RepID=A0ABQ1ASW7_9EURO|nr:putative short-chain dehydrogenase [Aspergillus udagawae]GFF87264.1 putative short-chain dehydrogenase [Aspergillus udagawae]GFG15875.1 putative short-chain dehydrogenase [Aspergillus udagawae]